MRPFDPSTVLSPLSERLVDPSFEDPRVHLHFEPVLNQYQPDTLVGETTIRKLFQEKDQHEGCAKLGEHVREVLLSASNQAAVDRLLATMAALVGREFFIEAYRAYWAEMNVGPRG